jgi:hypothetical protein
MSTWRKEGELYVLAQSRDRVAKERAMRRRQLKRLWARLKQISTMQLTREESESHPLSGRSTLRKLPIGIFGRIISPRVEIEVVQLYQLNLTMMQESMADDSEGLAASPVI